MSEQSRMTPPSEGRRERHPLTQEERDVREINALRARAEAAERERDKWEEREGRICPEDVGFEEYIKALQAQLTEAERAQQVLRANFAAFISERKIRREHGAFYSEKPPTPFMDGYLYAIAEIFDVLEGRWQAGQWAKALTGAPSETP